MRKRLPAGLFVFILLVATTLLVAAGTPRKGSIRGGIYLDLDGNGVCSATDTAVTNVDILFTSQDSSSIATLYSGSNGTYGLVAVAQGNWHVSISPTEWIVTSANPLLVSVSESGKLVQTDVNFCVQKGSGSGKTSTSTTTNSFTPSSDLTLNHKVSESLLSSSSTENSTTENTTTTATTEQTEPVAVDPVVENHPDWLTYLNHFRAMAGLHPFAESETLSNGARLHSQYMVANDKPIAHSENRTNFLFTPAGHQAAQNSNIFATSQLQATHEWGINFWISAPFHLLGIIDPELETVGYGQHNQAVGTFRMASVLDVGTERGNSTVDVNYPIFFPGDGQETTIVRRSLYEWPDPLSPCSGYSVPTGSAIVLQIGDGSLTPRVTGHTLLRNGQLTSACVYDETSYVNPNIYAQNAGRSILGSRDAIVMIPKRPLHGDATYTVNITANGETYTWDFTVRNP